MCQIKLICLGFFIIINSAHAASRTELYASAESFINAQPIESKISVANVLAKYQTLQERWVGAQNVGYNQVQIATNPLFAKSNMFGSTNSMESISFIKMFRLKYTTTTTEGIQNVSGLIIVPPIKNPKGVVLFFHSTIAGKLNVPSLHFNDYKALMLEAIFAANGYVVVAPDYIGLGDNYKSVHPYILYPKMNVTDGKDMLISALNMLYDKKIILRPKTVYPLFVNGYSEGASYALWFSRIYQENTNFAHSINSMAKLKLAKTVAIEGAYDLTGVMFPFLLTNQVNDSNNKFNINTATWGLLLKPELLANVMMAYSYYNHQPIEKLLNPNFYNLQCPLLPDSSCGQDDIGTNNLDKITFTQLKTFAMVLKYFWAAMFKSNQNVIYNPFFNSVSPLLYENVAEDQELLATAASANITNWQSKNPVTLVSLANDSLVPEQNSANAYQGMMERGSLNLKYLKIPNRTLRARALAGPNVSDHVSFELYALLIALQEFNGI